LFARLLRGAFDQQRCGGGSKAGLELGLIDVDADSGDDAVSDELGEDAADFFVVN
jgi:hypothetical protein